ncbi:hypothetical protein ACFYE2_05705 [Kocuria sp. CPCC 205300]|uniref:hypothetical protein n=1 Tax=Kocuria sabuli TaxID=3071448 RepID=UPI0036DE5849
MTDTPNAVRPTIRVVKELEISLPTLDVGLHALEHPLIEKSQDVPSQVEAGRFERIKSMTDRTWFKVKVNDDRGGVARLDEPTRDQFQGFGWWLGLCGKRVADSKQHNFYDNLPDSSSDYLPTEKDGKRLQLEMAYIFRQDLKRVARQATHLSLVTGKVAVIEMDGQPFLIKARVRMLNSGEAYISVGYMGAANPNFTAFVLGAFPGVEASDWQVEPSEVVEIHPEPGEMVYSALLPTEVQCQLLDEFSAPR